MSPRAQLVALDRTVIEDMVRARHAEGAALSALLQRFDGASASPSAPDAEQGRWDALLAGLEAVEATPANEASDDTIEAAGELAAALMAMPAAAVRWKLDFLLNDEGKGATGAWSAEFIAQAVADYRRFLGGA